MISADLYASQRWNDRALGNQGKNSVAWLPYSLGVLQSYAQSDDEIKKNYYFSDIEIFRKPYEQVLDSLDNPSVVATSNYIWNTRYHLNLLAQFP